MVAESFKGVEVYSWVGMVAPAKTPVAVLPRLVRNTALHEPALGKRLNEGGFEGDVGDCARINPLIASESQRWVALIKNWNIVAE